MINHCSTSTIVIKKRKKKKYNSNLQLEQDNYKSTSNRKPHIIILYKCIYHTQLNNVDLYEK